MTGNGLRLLVAARKSRKSADAASQYERQDHRGTQWAERQGHVVIHVTRDTKSGTSAPWTRKELKPWMTDADKLALYDAILISDTDRLSRGTDEDFHWIENWAYRNGKRIIVADGPQFPPREGAMGESDRYQWIAQKRAARTYWEATRDKHADTREIIKANGGALGKPPFGYIITGAKLHKTFEADPVWAPVVKEAFKRISEGHTTASVAIWLSEQTGRAWKVSRVTETIQRRAYLGESQGHTFEPLVSAELFNQANAALAGRGGIKKDAGGRRTVNGYSGLLYCECGAKLQYHYIGRGMPRYRCARGRNGDVTVARCGHGAPSFDAVNDAVNEAVSLLRIPVAVRVTTGGDYGRQMELQRLQDEMKTAMANMDMGEVQKLAQSISELQGMEAEPIRIEEKLTGRTYDQVWADSDLSERRALLQRDSYRIRVVQEDDGWQLQLRMMNGKLADQGWGFLAIPYEALKAA